MIHLVTQILKKKKKKKDKEAEWVKDLMEEGPDQLLLALMMEERVQEPKNAVASRSWR